MRNEAAEVARLRSRIAELEARLGGTGHPAASGGSTQRSHVTLTELGIWLPLIVVASSPAVSCWSTTGEVPCSGVRTVSPSPWWAPATFLTGAQARLRLTALLAGGATLMLWTRPTVDTVIGSARPLLLGEEPRPSRVTPGG